MNLFKKDIRLSHVPGHHIIIYIEVIILVFLLVSLFFISPGGRLTFPVINQDGNASPSEAKKYIKWVDFDVTARAMQEAFRYDVNTCQSEPHLNWVDLLSYLGAKYGGDFSRYSTKDLDWLAEQLLAGKTMEEMTVKMSHYSYYREAYGAVLDGLVGQYEIQISSENAPLYATPALLEDGSLDPDKVWVKKYGLKSFSPIAKGFPYNDFDDFGVARSYGYRRQHLGHDMMGQVGTPVIAVESGYVEAIGWNQYGGWRLGIRSFDGKRYYYYAHLRKNYPYHKSLNQGSIVTAGDVIGYLGRTGYSRNENTNNINEPHLHFGLQLIFDESQKEGNNEIWISCYELTKFLTMNRSQTLKNQETKEYNRVYDMKDPGIPENFVPPEPPKEEN
ncbi:M23 family metallopeptidase [Lacrimispora saccharolytica]|uniref:Peptidase M23 n=1 Tax=Lacrimispora saccharolytica (strain ATCC 35040 / DSM 2544 / NRCC 2533 / WM1) TaxID=610130 RepID=D9RAX6_LACSW|nr:peptidoglycan DD-metalloendopeptidase family protein [Lacrimispora saccharolytica]ADL06173.1 Peptidase M23 [[Clostridium] saccharolyticum WM1]QRV19720.1 M23 family metallopeptidase [Lacrimispora saccharolytica]